jgi:acetyl-CoA carboxylase biotin carboxyl carrier protein
MSTEIAAPMPGKVAKILVKVGDKVAEDDELITLEAMKMENPIFSTVDGTIKEIKVKEGESVSADQIMIILE